MAGWTFTSQRGVPCKRTDLHRHQKRRRDEGLAASVEPTLGLSLLRSVTAGQGLSEMPIVLEEQRIAYYPTPKVACSSLKSAFYELAQGHPYDAVASKEKDNVHKVYFSGPYRPLKKPDCYYKFAVVRDPIDRLVSAYSNRVVKYRELPDMPDFRNFVRDLEFYRMENWSIWHHTEGQWYFIGSDLSYFDRVFRFDELPLIPDEIERATGHRINLPHLQRNDRVDIAVETEELSLLTERYEYDYALLAADYAPRLAWGLPVHLETAATHPPAARY